MEETRLLRRFASFSRTGRIMTLAAALGITEREAEKILDKLIARLQYEESLARYLHSKKKIDLKIAQEIDQIMVKRFGSKTKPAKKKRLVLIHLAEIRQLRENGLTWTDIAKYLQKRYRLNVTRVWVKQVCEPVLKEIS